MDSKTDFKGTGMSDAYSALEEKNKIIKALSTALDRACDTLSEIIYVETLEEATILAESANEEIIEQLIAQGVNKDLLPNV